MTKLDAGLITSLPASDSGSAAVWGSKRINPRPQSCLCLTWSGCPSNDDDREWCCGTVREMLTFSCLFFLRFVVALVLIALDTIFSKVFFRRLAVFPS